MVLEPRTAEIVLVCPTLDILLGAETLAEAKDTAGLPVGALLISDYARRGGLVVSNVLWRAAMDWGARVAVFVNDDCSQFPAGWCKRLVEVLDSRPEIGVAVTGAPCHSAPQGKGKPGLPPAIIELQHPAAWVVAAVKTDVFRQVGYMDEGYQHYCDDTDLEMRMRAKGWRSVYVQDVWINHHMGQQWGEWYDADRARFKQKWGKG